MVYMNNAFDATILERVVGNLTPLSLQHPREATFVYQAPFQRHVTDSSPGLTAVVDCARWVIYRVSADGRSYG